MSAVPVLAVLGGMAVLVLGADLLVRGAARLASSAGVSALVVGLTVVAFGTSAPELAVSVDAAVSGAGGVALGNAVGSNIFNTLAILGVSALFGGLVVHQRLVRVDVPILLAVSGVVWWLGADGAIGVGEGVALLAGIAAYTLLVYRLGRRGAAAPTLTAPSAQQRARWPGSAGLAVVGLVALVAGARLLVAGATELAAGLGVSDLVVGLTVVAAGTSLPELATSVVATRRGERDIAVGNIIGSNMFNLLAVLGGAAVAGGGLPVAGASLATDLPVMVLATLLALPALALGLSVARWEGAVLLVGYAGYLGYLVMAGAGSPSAAGARRWLLVGLAAAALVVGLVGWLQARAAPRRPGPGADGSGPSG